MRTSLKVAWTSVFAGLLMVALPVSGAVYRVSPDGIGDGSSWGEAGQFAVMAASAQSGDEIWLKEGTYQGGVSIAVAVTLRGGFAGTETAADQRADGGVSTISGGSTALAFSVASGTAEVERLVITEAQQHGVTFDGAGSLSLTDCQITRNGRISDQSSNVSTDGRGLYADGASASSVLTLTRCAFSENQEIRNSGFGTPGQPGADGFGGSGATTGLALYANAFKGVSLTDCTFTRNGTFPSPDLVTAMPGRGVKTGSVVYFNDAPVTAKGVRFIGNRIIASGICAGRIVAVCGAGGSSSFTDCTWTANDIAAWLANTSANNLPDCNLHTGALVLELDKNSSAVTLSGCTFAYNVVPLGWTAGLRVLKGTVNVDTSVFWGNMVTRNLFSCADIFTSTYGRVNLSNSLLSARDETALNLSSGLITLGDGMVYGDPQFGTTASAFVDGYLTKGSGVTFHADGVPYATVPKRGLKPSTDYTFMVKKASDVTAIDVTPSADGIWKKAVATAPSAPSVTAEANGDARVTFTVTAGATGDAGELTLCYGAALTGAATEPDSYPHSVQLGRLAPGLVTAFETPGVFAQGDTVKALVVASNAKGAAKGTAEVAITCETPGPWASKTLGVHPVDINPQYWEGNKNLNKFSLNLDTAAQNGRESWTRGHQVRWFRHETDPAWEAVVAEQSDTFAVGLPSDGEQPDRPLYVLLHSRGSGGHPNMGAAGVYDIMASDKNTACATPTNMYALVLDCMESMERDFWWGGMPSAKGGEVHVADLSHPYFSYYDGQLFLGCCMCEGPTDQPFLDKEGRVCKTPSCLEHNLNGENPCLRRIMDTIEWVVRKYRIDRNRIYLGGNSMGGQGALGIGLAHGDVFAAIHGNVPATIWYAAGRMGFVTPTGEDVAAEDYVPPAFDPPVCIDWSGSDDTWSRRHDVLYRNMNRFRMQITGWWGNYGHCGDLVQARGTNDLVCSFDIFKIRKNEAYPVFSNTSCDDMLPWPEVAWSGGNSSSAAGGFEVVDGGLIRREGSPAIGQVNSWFKYEILEDTAERLIADFWIASPEEMPSKHFSRPVRAMTDISFRRLQAFPHAKGAKAKWMLNDGTPGKGVVALDSQLGVYTVQGVQLSQSKTRLTLTPSGDEATAAGHLAILDNPRVTSGTVTPKVQLTLDSLGGASSVPVTFEIAANPAFAFATTIQGAAMTAAGATQVAALPTLDVGAVRYVRAKLGDNQTAVTPVFVLTAGAPDIKVTVVQSPTIPSKTYTGGTLTATVPESEQYTVVANAGGVDVGFYDVTLKLADPVTTGWADSSTDELTLRFEITRAGNAWATEPAISKGSWKQGTEPAVITAGVGTFGGTAEMTLDGQAFAGATLPTDLALGSHTLVFTVGETPNYAGLSKTITFRVSDAATTGYIHVGGPSASDENFGATWNQAVATLARAAELVADDEEGELKEIRIAGDIKASATTPVFTRAIAIRGGFAGTESTVDQRPLGDVSTVDGKGTCRFLDIRFTEGDVLIDSVAFTDGLSQALKLTGGAGATATLTNVTISSCRYRTKDAAQYDQPGAAIWAKDLGALRLVDCRITDCGPLTMAEVAAARTKSNTGAIHLSSTPVTAVGCVFAGNRSAARDNAAGYGSVIRIAGASGACAFTRCAFYGNRALADTCAGDNADTGALYFAPSSDAATLALDYCTFANNAAYFGGDGASLAVKKGTVTVTHSIFAGSVKKSKATSAVEISVASGATLNIDTSLVSEKATAVGGSGTVAWGGTVLEGDPLFAATAPVTWDTSSTAYNQTARSPVLDWTLIDVVLQSGSPCAGWGACPDGEAPVPHEHSYVWTTKSEATCTAAKVEEGVCSCGKTTERTVGGPLGHDFANGTSAGHLDPTPTTDGYDKVKCARCDEVQTTVLPATGGDPATDGLTILSQYETNVVCKSVTRQGTVYRHAGDARWGGSAGEQQNTFAVIRPSAAVSGKVPLVVSLHSANDFGIWLALKNCDVTTSDSYDFFQTPSGFYGLYLDCREHQDTDWWWGQQGNGENGSNRNNNTGTSLSPCENRVLATLKWVMANYNIDPERVYIQGNSMGGSGALGIGLRHGDIFAAIRAQVPAGFGHAASRLAFDFNATATSVATGTDFIRALPDPPILVETSSDNDDWSAGRNLLVHNMRARKYAHMCLWAPMGHYHTENSWPAGDYTGVINAYDWRSVKLHEAYPVFTDATSDSPLLDPWSTKASDYGQRNIYFRWTVKEDTAETFQIDLKLGQSTNTRFPTAPSESTANVTLRRLQNFPHAAGQTVSWSYGGEVGTVTIDSLGVYTIPGLKVTPSAATLTLTAGEPPAPGHVHAWGDWTTNGVTCVTDGTRTRTCAKEDCPVKTEAETVKALGHDWQKTGEDDEYTYFKCSRCEETKSEKKEYPPVPVAGNKWFRFTMTKKLDGTTPILALGEFALFSADGTAVSGGLTRNKTSVASLQPGEFYLDKGSGSDENNVQYLFDGTSGNKMTVNNVGALGSGSTNHWQKITMRLADSAAEVVKYNLRAASDIDGTQSRAVTAWILETSADGKAWTKLDEKFEATSGYSVANSGWYKNGGGGAKPTAFYEFGYVTAPIGFFVNGVDVGDTPSGSGWHYAYGQRTLTLNDVGPYVISGEATNDEVQVRATTDEAKVVLSNMTVFASNRPAFEVAQSCLTIAANQVMRTGKTSDKLAYATSYKEEPCVLAATGVTVTVKDIPHVTDVVVSNRTETIPRAMADGVTAYRVMAGDDVYVYYTVEEGCTSQSPNPLVYQAIKEGKTVNADTIRILSSIPYRAWNETERQMENRVCTNYTVVTADTEIFEGGKWYVVTGAVSRGTVTVAGSAHLILCDGAKLTCDGTRPNAYKCGEPGILLDDLRTLCVYGQTEGSGTLEAMGADDCAGIGSGAGDSWTAGGLTVDGGVVFATGRDNGAGIGGSNTPWWANYGNGGTVTVNGGRVTATGGSFAAGIGGGSQGRGAVVTIRGGTVLSQGGQGGFGHGYGASDNGTLTIDGGSVRANAAKDLAKNSTPTNVHCVTAKCEGLKGLVRLEVLGGYGTNDIHAVDNRVYLWLPDGTHDFALSDGETTYRYHAVVDGADITVAPTPQTVPVTPGVPVVCDTAEAATNAAKKAELTPSDEVAKALGADADAKAAYCAKFGFAVVPTSGGQWAVVAALKPESWSNLVESAQRATRQIDVAGIASLPLGVETNVMVKGCCEPGFYYALYSGSTVTNLLAVADEEGRNVLCAPDRQVEFAGAMKPSDAAGFFSIGVKETSDVLPSDRAIVAPGPVNIRPEEH